MKIREIIETLRECHNQDVELILAFADGSDTTDYAFIEDNTAYDDFTYLTVNGCFDKEIY